MTAVLKDLRSLRAARDRGEISHEQFARAEAVLHDMIEDAVLDAAEPAPRAREPRARATDASEDRRTAPAAKSHDVKSRAKGPSKLSTPARLWETLAMVSAGLACVTAAVAALIGSMTLALTLLVTMIAAASVWALKHLDE